MKTKVIKISFIIFLIGALFSCEDDFLEKYPKDAPAASQFYSNKEELILAINGCYEDLIIGQWNSRKAFPIHLDVLTDIAWERYGYSTGIGAHDPESYYPNTVWNNYYDGIGNTNMLLNDMQKAQDNVNDNLYNRIQAEAKFIRAYMYHHLEMLYGDVPLITEVPSLDNTSVARTERSKVVDFVLSELEAAAQNLPKEYSASEHGRATKGAALTIKAREALYHERWEAAIDATQRVMDMGTYSLYPDYENLFKYEGENCSEVIFDYNWTKGIKTHMWPQDMLGRNVGGWSLYIPLQSLLDSYHCTDGEPIDESPLYDQAHPFQNRDPRLDASVIIPGELWGNYVFYTHPDSTETWQVKDGDSTRVANQNVLNPYATYSGYLWDKYNDVEDVDNKYESELDWILARYAEVLLIYAEAKIENADIDQSVLNAINKVKARAYGVDVSQTDKYPAVSTTNREELRKIVRYERKVEFPFEGLRLYDLKRWGIADIALNIPVYGRPNGVYSILENPPEIDEHGIPHYNGIGDKLWTISGREFNEHHYLWPIPQSEMDLNNKLEQNPGY